MLLAVVDLSRFGLVVHAAWDDWALVGAKAVNNCRLQAVFKHVGECLGLDQRGHVALHQVPVKFIHDALHDVARTSHGLFLAKGIWKG